jgi:hypothetical protein
MMMLSGFCLVPKVNFLLNDEKDCKITTKNRVYFINSIH